MFYNHNPLMLPKDAQPECIEKSMEISIFSPSKVGGHLRKEKTTKKRMPRMHGSLQIARSKSLSPHGDLDLLIHSMGKYTNLLIISGYCVAVDLVVAWWAKKFTISIIQKRLGFF